MKMNGIMLLGYFQNLLEIFGNESVNYIYTL